MTPQELKNSILQLAIQGKLVEQRPQEGTAEELYRQIQAEKQRLIKEGKIKKEKPLPEIAEEEKPFEIPEGWMWVRFGEIGHLLDGIMRADSPYPYLDARYLRGKAEPTIIDCGKFVAKGTFTILVDGENSGEVFQIHEDGYMGSTFKVLYFSDFLNTKYVLNFLLYHKADYRNNKKGAAIPHLNKDLFFNMLFPIPPLAEQKRIVAKIEELLPYIDRYEQAWSKLENFNKRFPIDMQKSILQTAIQGKLVEQRPEEGTGEELYQQIQAEKQALIKSGKIKKEKPLPEITDEEKPFEIPESWKFVRLGNAISLLSGTDFAPDEYNDQGNGTVYITGASNLSDTGVIISRWTTTPRNIANQGDILLVCKGSGYGKTVICDVSKAHIARQIMAIQKIKTLDMNYIRYFLISNFDYIKSKGQGVIPGIDRMSILNIMFPLPPLAEQKRMVAKLETLLPLCERLK